MLLYCHNCRTLYICGVITLLLTRHGYYFIIMVPPPPTRTPLQVYPGDTLLFDCPNGSNSNAWYQVSVEGVGESGGCGWVWRVWICQLIAVQYLDPPWDHLHVCTANWFGMLHLCSPHFVSPITEETCTHHQTHHFGLGFVLKCYQSMCIQSTILAGCSHL